MVGLAVDPTDRQVDNTVMLSAEFCHLGYDADGEFCGLAKSWK